MFINSSYDEEIILSILFRFLHNFKETVSPTYLMPNPNKTFSKGMVLDFSIPAITLLAHFLPSFLKGSKSSYFKE